MIHVSCNCGKSFDVDDAHAGKTGRCKGCGEKVQIPYSIETSPVELWAAEAAEEQANPPFNIEQPEDNAIEASEPPVMVSPLPVTNQTVNRGSVLKALPVEKTVFGTISQQAVRPHVFLRFAIKVFIFFSFFSLLACVIGIFGLLAAQNGSFAGTGIFGFILPGLGSAFLCMLFASILTLLIGSADDISDVREVARRIDERASRV